MHELRKDPDFVPELDLVLEKDGIIVGQNIFMRAVIQSDDDRKMPIMTMGPISILPEFKRMGYLVQLVSIQVIREWGMEKFYLIILLKGQQNWDAEHFALKET